MLLPDSSHPKHSIYYTGAVVLKVLQRNGPMSLADLYVAVKESEGMSFKLLILSLDWLYLINAALLSENGEVTLCS